MRSIRYGFFTLIVIGVVGIIALLTPSAEAQTTQDSAAPPAESLPVDTMLQGFQWVHQGVNRCSAAALTIHLSYYQPVSLDTYNEFATQSLNTYGGDVSVRIEEMRDEIDAIDGLNAIVRRGGTVDLMRRLLAAGFPTLVENVYYDGSNVHTDWLSHNRVLIGYNDALQTFYFQDPLRGFPNGKIIEYTYDDFDERWRPFNRDYMIIYRDDEADALQQVLGQQWDAAYNAQWTLEQAQTEIDTASETPLRYSYYNRGWAQLQLEQYEAAAESFDLALANDNLGTLGQRLPLRYLWYDFSPFEAYIEVGRYDDALALARQQIATAGDTVSVEEWYYWAGRAHEGIGNIPGAIQNYEVALYRQNNFTAARERLEALQAGS